MFRNLRYFISEGFKSFFRNWTMSIACVIIVTSCLLTFGMYLAISINLNNVVNIAKNELEITFFLNRETDEKRVKEIGEEFSQLENVLTCTLKSKEEALAIVSEQWDAGNDASFLPDSYTVTFETLENAVDTSNKIMEIPEVQKSTASEDSLKLVDEISRSLNIFALVLMIIMVTISMFIINNTIKLTVVARR